MTRFLALSIAALALAFGACEKHPLEGQTAVTFVPGIDGVGAEHSGEARGGEAQAKKDEPTAPAAEKKEGAPTPAEPKQ